MKKKPIPIKTIIKRVEELSKDYNSNKTMLDKYSKLVKDQREYFSKISENAIKNNLNKSNLSLEDYKDYKFRLKEKRYYEKYRKEISYIVNENYKSINKERVLKKIKLGATISSSTLFIILSSLGFNALMKHIKTEQAEENSKYIILEDGDEIIKLPKITIDDSEEETEEEYIEPTTEIIVQNLTTEETTEETTEKTTEATTEETTEKTTEATTETYIYIGEEAIKGDEVEEVEVIDINDDITIVKKGTDEVTVEQEEIINKIEELETDEVTEQATANDSNMIYNEAIDEEKLEEAMNFYFNASDYLDIMENTILDDEKREEAKEQAKNKAIDYIDFIFYGDEINGIKFSDLKDEQKSKLFKELKKLDSVISKEDPDYKERFGERYGRLKDFSSQAIDKTKEKVKERIGEDTYDQLNTIKEDTGNSIKDIGKILKKSISNSYNNWKNEDN